MRWLMVCAFGMLVGPLASAKPLLCPTKNKEIEKLSTKNMNGNRVERENRAWPGLETNNVQCKNRMR
jgi:hypothetical protein